MKKTEYICDELEDSYPMNKEDWFIYVCCWVITITMIRAQFHLQDIIGIFLSGCMLGIMIIFSMAILAKSKEVK